MTRLQTRDASSPKETNNSSVPHSSEKILINSGSARMDQRRSSCPTARSLYRPPRWWGGRFWTCLQYRHIASSGTSTSAPIPLRTCHAKKSDTTRHPASNPERPTHQVLLSFGSNPFPKACNHSFALLTYSPACSFSKTLGTTANPFSRSCFTCAGSCAPVARSLRTEEEEVGRVVVWVWVAIGIVGVLIVVGK
jgi:hypothetical protein